MVIDITDTQKIRVDIVQLKKLANFVFQQERIKNGYLSVALVNDKTIKQLNKKYRGINQSTDVLAFDLSEGEKFIGDIAISVQTASAKAKELKCMMENEIFLYLTHGILHLLDYDDTTQKEYLKMERRQKEIIKKFSIFNLQ